MPTGVDLGAATREAAAKRKRTERVMAGRLFLHP
jgi:hypothetical protein